MKMEWKYVQHKVLNVVLLKTLHIFNGKKQIREVVNKKEDTDTRAQCKIFFSE